MSAGSPAASISWSRPRAGSSISSSEPAPTVDELFDRIERDMVTIAGHCGPNGCGCDGTIVVRAVYDARFGFPHSKRVYLDSLARWRFPEYWRQRLSGELCSYRDFGRDIITVVSLTPRL
jgi:hypothetical protein